MSATSPKALPKFFTCEGCGRKLFVLSVKKPTKNFGRPFTSCKECDRFTWRDLTAQERAADDEQFKARQAKRVQPAMIEDDLELAPQGTHRVTYNANIEPVGTLAASPLAFLGTVAVLEEGISGEREHDDPVVLDDSFSPSTYQAAIYTWLREGSGHAVVMACPGSGKTTTLKHAAPYLPRGKRIVALAFGKKNAKDLERVMPDWIDCRTFHSLALRNVMAAYGRGCQVEERKGWTLLDELVRELKNTTAPGVTGLSSTTAAEALEVLDTEGANVLKLVGLMKNTLSEDLDALSEHYGIAEGDSAEIVHELAQYIFHRSISQCRKWVDFDDMIYLCAVGRVACAQYDFILVDETQDQNRARLEMMVRMIAPGGRVLAVGDPCQPEGTMITVCLSSGNRWHEAEFGQVPIESLKIGDHVVTPSLRDGAYYSNGTINGITRRPYEGHVIVAEIDGARSRYTPNHHCLASFAPFKGQHALYLMRRGDQFRIGISQLFENPDASGPLARLRTEEADAMWILAFYETRQEALVMEQAVGGKFGIPQLVFNGRNLSIEGLAERAWEMIGDNADRGTECLEHFGRDVQYPLFTDQHNWQQSLKRPQEVYAANLMDGCLVLSHNGTSHFGKHDWLPVTLSLEPYTGDVYSLDVSHDHLYIADGIVTHNCQSIFGFAGADTTAIPNIIARLGAVTLPLSISYRLPLSHVALLNERFPEQHIEARADADAGEIKTISETGLWEHVQPGDMVVCRTNAPLVEPCFALIRQGIKAVIVGRDIGKGLIAMLERGSKRSESTDVRTVQGWLTEWSELEAARLSERNKNTQAASLLDQVATLAALGAECNTVLEVKARINTVFSDEAEGVVFSSVHRAKGLESEHVYLLHPELIPHPMCKAEWEISQEQNILFVALSRSKHSLYFVTSEESR